MPIFRFNNVEFHVPERRLLIDGAPAMVGARALDLLDVLLAERHRVVAKNELLDRAWPGLVVEEANVQVQVSALRKVIGHDAVATVPGVGYRFVAPLLGARSSPTSRIPPAPRHPASSGCDLLGRDDDLRDVLEMLDQSRLVTVVGAGGVGKTRLARASVEQLLTERLETVGWADLSERTSLAQVLEAVASAAHVSMEALDVPVQLARRLGDSRMIIVLDNCEHVVQHIAAIAQAVLAGCPSIRLLATSQEPLRLGGEQVFKLLPLPIPPPDARAEVALLFPTLQLLEACVTRLDRHFRLAEADVPEAMSLCRGLDGNPLAIEMAASRIPQLGLKHVARNVGRAIEWAVSSRRDVAARQRSLYAMLEWTCGLLSADEADVLQRLSVLAGRFTLDLATNVGASPGRSAEAVVEAISGLIDRSLIHVEQPDPPSYRLPETVRAFARFRLELGEAAMPAERHYCAVLAAAAERALDERWSMPQAEWEDRTIGFLPDIERSCELACASHDATAGAALITLLSRLDRIRSRTAEVRARKRAAFALLPHGDPLARARLWECIAQHGALTIPEVRRRVANAEAVAAWSLVGDEPSLYRSLWHLAVDNAPETSPDEVRAARDKALALEQTSWPPSLLWEGAIAFNHVTNRLHGPAGYRDRYRRTMSLAVRAKDARAIARTRLNWADEALMAGDIDEALNLGVAVVGDLEQLDQPAALGWAWANLCAARLAAGDQAAAVDAARSAFPLMWSQGWLVDLLNHVALIAARGGDSQSALVLLGYVQRSYSENDDEALPNEARLGLQARELAEAATDKQDVVTWLTRGEACLEPEIREVAYRVLMTF